MAITFVEAIANVTAGPLTNTCTFGTATTTGELIVACLVATTSLGGATVGDGTDTYSNVFDASAGSGFEMLMCYACNVSSGITAVTAALPSDAGKSVFCVGHWTMAATSSPLDKSQPPTPTSAQGTPYNSASVTTTQAAELLVGYAFAHNTGGATVTVSPTGSWINAANGFDNNGDNLALFYQIVSSIQTNVETTGTYSTTSTAGAYAGIGTFFGLAPPPGFAIGIMNSVVVVG